MWFLTPKALAILAGTVGAGILMWFNLQALAPDIQPSTAEVEQRIQAARVWQYHPQGTLEVYVTAKQMERAGQSGDQTLLHPYAAMYDLNAEQPPVQMRAESGFLTAATGEVALKGRVHGERAAFADQPIWRFTSHDLHINREHEQIIAESEAVAHISAVNQQQALISISQSNGIRIYPDQSRFEQFGGVRDRIIPATEPTGAAP